MKSTNILKEIKEKDNAALNKSLTDLNQQLTKLRLEAAMNRLKNVKSIKAVRNQIAQTLTVLNERAINESNKA